MSANANLEFPPARTAEQWAAQGRDLERAGRFDDAESAYRSALALSPDHLAIIYNLGALCLRRGDIAAALAWFERCRQLRPKWATAYLGIGRALLAARRLDEAVAAIQHAVALDPQMADARNSLGIALEVAGEVSRAEQAFREAVRLNPASTPAISNLCDLLGRSGRALQAARELEDMLSRMPDDAGILFKLGYVKAYLDDLERAETLMRRVVELAPMHAPAFLNLGTFAQWRQDAVSAVAHFRHALELAPRDPVIEGNLAHALLYAGDYAEGWKAYETRPMGVRHENAARIDAAWGPRWDGSDLHGGTLLLHGEGGFGDVLQLCRYAAPARERAGAVVVWLERKYRSLATLVATVPGIDVVLDEDTRGTASAYCSLSSLPYLLWRGDQPCASPMPYLSSDPRRRKVWRARLGHDSHCRVGLVWRGGPGEDRFYGSLVDRRRSVPFPMLEPLFGVPGVRLHSLQKGNHADEWRQFGFAESLIDHTAELSDFADTAAYASELDLIITVDTSVAHMAGGLGLLTWMLNRYDSCWRWGIRDTRTHWYPSLRIFRQPNFGDWETTIDMVKHELERFARS